MTEEKCYCKCVQIDPAWGEKWRIIEATREYWEEIEALHESGFLKIGERSI